MNKILILVVSQTLPPYDRLMAGQIATWESIPCPDVETLFLLPGTILERHGKLLFLPPFGFGDEVWGMVLQAFRFILDLDWTFVFHTNASSYVHKSRLLKFSESLPKTKCYCGIPLEYPGFEGQFASGSGFLISRDVVQLLSEKMETDCPNSVEDVGIGMLLHKYGNGVTPGAQLYRMFAENPPTGYHYRCKSFDPDDRSLDVKAFEYLKKTQH
jgi:hypothetical protein